jgi:serine phosphatase RsbU (regulator of sigma subunit)
MMAEEITVHFKNYRDNAEKKHREIMAQKAEIEDKTLMLEDQRNLLAQQNKSMTDSISYAQRLQRSLFPNNDQMHQILGDHLLMFQPKDIVSGDFYWVEETADSIYFGVIDCTGHGVPGAFMSVLGYNYLSMALHVMDLRETNDILDFINKSISVRLNQHSSEGEIKDGMDLGLCRYMKGGDVVQFSGANRPMVVIRNGEAKVYDSDRLHIGWNFENQRQPFTAREISLEKDDLVFLFSDGYNDQFGGAKDKKFKFNQFRALLSESDPKNLGRTSKLIIDTFLTWKGQADQVDDVCVLGVRAGNLMERDMGVRHIDKLKTADRPDASREIKTGLSMVSNR